MKTYQHYIDGAYVDPAQGEWFDSVDPYHGEVWARIPRGIAAEGPHEERRRGHGRGHDHEDRGRVGRPAHHRLAPRNGRFSNGGDYFSDLFVFHGNGLYTVGFINRHRGCG